MESLNSIKTENSGCIDFDRDKFKDYYLVCVEEEKRYRHQYSKNFRKFAKLLLFEKFSDFEEQVFKDPSILAEKEIKVLWAYIHILQGKKMLPSHFLSSMAPPYSKRRLSQGLAYILIDIFGVFQRTIKFSDEIQAKLNDFNFFSLKDILPDVTFYYAQYILEYKLEDKYNLVRDELLNYQFVNFCNGVENIEQRLEAERVRLLSFYYRVTGNVEEAEKYMLIYRKIMPADITVDLSPQIRSKTNSSYFPASETLENWAEVLQECDDVQDHVIEISGLYKDTCGYYDCADCCNYTSPHMSLTEYKYLKAWAEKHNYSFDKAIAKAKEIQENHKELHGEELKIIDKALPENKEKGRENPYSYKYSCPFLIDNRCSVYEARPLLCRGFGLSSDDNLAVKTCNFYLGQYTHNCSRDNERYVYDLRPAQLMATESDRHISKQEGLDKKELKGTIVAWLSQSEY